MPRTYRSSRQLSTISPYEKAKQDRRIARAIKSGMPMNRIERAYHTTEKRVLSVAESFGLQIVKGQSGKGNWWR